MATTAIPIPTRPAVSMDVRPAVTPTAPIPWYLWTLVLALALVTLGGQLDVSWHRSIGRDSFWTPPHVMVYLCGILAAISCGFLLLRCTFGHDLRFQETSVTVLGLRAPLGALVTAWGGLLMLYSAPFDNWWHNAYGLDVQADSPPHILLLAGTWAVCQGTLLLSAAPMNRTRLSGIDSPTYRRLFLVVGAMSVIHLMSYAMGYTFDTRLHAWKAYFVISTGVPFALAALVTTLHRAAPTRPGLVLRAEWTATKVALIYTAFMLLLVWLLPLIPATPRLGPIFQPVTHMVPPKFPILLLPAAFIFDLIYQVLNRQTAGRETQRTRPWLTALLAGPAWLLTLLAFEWPFATFLMSDHAANRFFATRIPDFGTPSGTPDILRIFENPQHGRPLFLGLFAAAVIATLGIRLGQTFGTWMRTVRR